jgi:hypothetical protein
MDGAVLVIERRVAMIDKALGIRSDAQENS